MQCFNEKHHVVRSTWQLHVKSKDQDEVRIRIMLANKYYFWHVKLMKKRFLSQKKKVHSKANIYYMCFWAAD